MTADMLGFRLWARESRCLDVSIAAMLARPDTEARGRFCEKRCGPSRRRARTASAVLKNFVRQPEKTFSTVSANNGQSLQPPVLAYFTSWNDNGPVRHQRGGMGTAGEASGYVGNIPQHYDQNLGPLLFTDYAADLAGRIATLNPPGAGDRGTPESRHSELGLCRCSNSGGSYLPVVAGGCGDRAAWIEYRRLLT
jgi:hypothetical protein